MGFVDEVVISVKAGDGGSGCVSFQRKRFQPKAGPDGGNGGNGGNVYLRATDELNSLEPYRFKKFFRAENGRHGQGNDRDGRRGKDLFLDVPLGTVVIDTATGLVIKELLKEGETFLIAKGGLGGKGNKHFATSTNRAPRIATKGKAGEERKVRLILKTIADVGLVGLPNAGKSTLLSRLTNARPKIGDYPFTTLTPHVGVLAVSPERSVLIADIPGLIEGASEGKGLGHVFLRHIERTRLLLILLSLDYHPRTSLDEDFDILIHELEAYNPTLVKKPRIVSVNKMDLKDSAKRDPEALKRALEERGERVILISALTGDGLEELIEALDASLNQGDLTDEGAVEAG